MFSILGRSRVGMSKEQMPNVELIEQMSIVELIEQMSNVELIEQMSNVAFPLLNCSVIVCHSSVIDQ